MLNSSQEDDLLKSQIDDKKKLPRILKKEMNVRSVMFKRSMRITQPGSVDTFDDGSLINDQLLVERSLSLFLLDQIFSRIKNEKESSSLTNLRKNATKRKSLSKRRNSRNSCIRCEFVTSPLSRSWNNCRTRSARC